MSPKNISAYSLAFSFLLSSCSSNLPKSSTQVIPSIRQPSSYFAEENLKSSFETILNSKNPENDFLASLTLLKSVFVRAEAILSDYDKELDEASTNATHTSFDNSKSYKKMIVIWGISHSLQDKIFFNYLSLYDLSNDQTISPSKRKMAQQLLLKFQNKLNSNDVLEKISFDELKSTIAFSLKEKNEVIEKSFAPNTAPATSFKNDQEKLNILRKYREQFRSLGRTAQAANDELNQKIESESEKLQLIDQAGRDPQQAELVFYPSTGTHGNIMGLVFPKNTWALTYDDGPHPVHTPAIVKNLNELGIKATFFWLAENVIIRQSIVDLVRRNGLPTENHSWSHANLPKQSDEILQKEIVQSTEVETKSYGEKPLFFRCPYGAGNSDQRIRKMLADNGMIHVFWNVDTLDWQDKDPDSILARAKKQMKEAGRGVILFHDIHPQSVIASKKLVEWSKTLKGTENEIRWVTIPEIVNELNNTKK